MRTKQKIVKINSPTMPNFNENFNDSSRINLYELFMLVIIVFIPRKMLINKFPIFLAINIIVLLKNLKISTMNREKITIFSDI